MPEKYLFHRMSLNIGCVTGERGVGRNPRKFSEFTTSDMPFFFEIFVFACTRLLLNQHVFAGQK